MGYGSRALLALGALVLALCVLVTASGEGLQSIARDDRAPAEPRDEDAPSAAEGDNEEAVERDQLEENDRDDATPTSLLSGRLAALVLLAALIALVIGLIARLRVSLRRRRLSGDRLRPTLLPSPQPDPDEDTDEVLAEALGGALDDLTHGSARNSIVAAWLRLEQASESEWFERNPADTPSEFVERVLSSYTLDGEVIGRLAGLYREARFSSHPITDRQRDEAAACLATLLDGLRTRAPGGHR